jgi:hypothetical protein
LKTELQQVLVNVGFQQAGSDSLQGEEQETTKGYSGLREMKERRGECESGRQYVYVRVSVYMRACEWVSMCVCECACV